MIINDYYDLRIACMTGGEPHQLGANIVVDEKLDVTAEVTINMAKHTISGSAPIFFDVKSPMTISDGTITGATRAFMCSSTLHISSIDFEECNSNDSGSVLCATSGAIVTVSGCNILRCNCKGPTVYIDSGCKLTIDTTEFNSNISTNEASCINCNGDLEMYKCTFEWNTGVRTSCIWVDSENAQISDTRFYHNNSSGGFGGVISSWGKLTVTASHFETNTGGGDSQGGCIYNCGRLVVEGTEFIGNESGKEGGAIAVVANEEQDQRLTISSCEFTSNMSGEAGGAIYSEGHIFMTACKFDQNTSGAEQTSGGAIHSKSHKMISIESGECTITNNSPCNIYLDEDSYIQLSGSLTGVVRIYGATKGESFGLSGTSASGSEFIRSEDDLLRGKIDTEDAGSLVWVDNVDPKVTFTTYVKSDGNWVQV